MNAIGRWTGVTASGRAMTLQGYGLTWGYDALGQVVSEEHADSRLSARDRGFKYDAIGNRTASIAGDTDTSKAGAVSYTANQVNQYTAIGNFGPTYDHDGNQIDIQTKADPLNPQSTLNNRHLLWDGEGRLIALKDDTDNLIATYHYDAQSRRIAKTVNGVTEATIYDGWNPVADYTLSGATATLQTSYLWGLDLSGTLQGAGGVGGLLSVTKHGTPISHFYPTFDGNGNVSEYLDSTGSAVAHYEYEAFGNVVVANGPATASFKHRFSTKPQNGESGLLYYGYRSYDPAGGRWVSRDPIEERGGVNLYGFVSNCAVRFTDTMGMGKMQEVHGHKGWSFRFDYGAGHGGGNNLDPSHFHFTCNGKPVLRRVYLDGSQRKHGVRGIDRDVPEAVYRQAAKQKSKSIKTMVSDAKVKIRASNKRGGGRGALGLLGVAIALNELSGQNETIYHDMKVAVDNFLDGTATNGDAITIAVGIQQITGSSFGAIAVYDALYPYEN